MEGALANGLTALHGAVLQDDREQVRALLKSREYGVDVRSSTGATPLMIAALYGRTKIFFYLVKKKASLQKYDYQNLAVIQYARGPMVRDLVQGYQDIATTGDQPRQRGRHSIYYFLKHANKNSQPRRAQGAQSSETPASVAPPPITIFLRSRDGKQLELMGVQRLATTSVDKDLGRKSTGTVRGKNEAANIYTFAVSGWAGVKGNNVLCNKEYSGLVRRVCSMYGFKLEGSWLDNRWRGDPAEKKGSYLSSHAEKQLGIWVLVESLSRALGTKELTVENLARLKELSHQLPARLRETLIELDHEPCSSCINFLSLLRQKAGLAIKWKSRKWFVEGQRPRLPRRDSHPVMGGNSKNDDDYTLDELDEDGDEDEFDNSSATLEQEDHDAAAATAITDPIVEGAAPDPSPSLAEGTHRRAQPRRLLRRHASDPYRKGRSPIDEPPQNKLPRWPAVDVTPRPPTPLVGNLRTRFGYNTENHLSPLEDKIERILDSNLDVGIYKVKWKDSSVTTWELAEKLKNAQAAIDNFKQATEANATMEDVDLPPEDL